MPHFRVDIPRWEIDLAGGSSIEKLIEEADETYAQGIMANVLKKIIDELQKNGTLGGFLVIGGDQGSTMVSPPLKSLPIGFSKVLVSTKVTQEGMWPYGAAKDVVVIPPVADLAGLKGLTKKVLADVANAIVGMVRIEVSMQGNSL